ncbi:hypothetical protein BOTBODRAFT_339567 [Botryobasidium botryosum FD-172 SS1]|uniref:Uncharacterized protein n=1 Tax=Botryobasidium botryosum (strain FD-172 SS1) TaxID=930990 RepID=A0A067MG08_BOTB1|nr:hypothetical protein BOTBODRAFT_339567 [Botryobasidium botryosum FD-172 SS1]
MLCVLRFLRGSERRVRGRGSLACGSTPPTALPTVPSLGALCLALCSLPFDVLECYPPPPAPSSPRAYVRTTTRSPPAYVPTHDTTRAPIYFFLPFPRITGTQGKKAKTA